MPYWFQFCIAVVYQDNFSFESAMYILTHTHIPRTIYLYPHPNSHYCLSPIWSFSTLAEMKLLHAREGKTNNKSKLEKKIQIRMFMSTAENNQ